MHEKSWNKVFRRIKSKPVFMKNGRPSSTLFKCGKNSREPIRKCNDNEFIYKIGGNDMDYEKIYIELGFQVEPLPSNYTPDVYAKELMQNTKHSEGVIYAISTNDCSTKAPFYK